MPKKAKKSKVVETAEEKALREVTEVLNGNPLISIA